jgi:hypothetical protein
VKILNLDFGKECADRKTLVKQAFIRIKEKVTKNDKEEFEEIMKGAELISLERAQARRKLGKQDHMQCRYGSRVGARM